MGIKLFIWIKKKYFNFEILNFLVAHFPMDSCIRGNKTILFFDAKFMSFCLRL